MPYVLMLDFAKLMMWPADWRSRWEYRRCYEELFRRSKLCQKRQG